MQTHENEEERIDWRLVRRKERRVLQRLARRMRRAGIVPELVLRGEEVGLLGDGLALWVRARK